MPLAETAEYSISSEVLELTCPNRFGYDNRHWVQWAWAVLARAGDVPPTVGEDDADYPRHLITIIALSHLSDVFGEVAAGVDGDLEVSVEPVGEFRPKITVIELARYCEREGIYAMEYPETDWGLVQQAVRVRTGEIARRLREILGVSRRWCHSVEATPPVGGGLIGGVCGWRGWGCRSVTGRRSRRPRKRAGRCGGSPVTWGVARR